MLWLTYPPNLQSLPSAVTEIWNALKIHKMGVVWGVVRGHPRSSEMLPFDRAHTTSYSTLIETMRLSCTVVEIRSGICRNSPTLPYPTSIWRPRWGWPRSNFEKMIWHQKTRVPGLSCGVVCVFLCLAILVEHRLVTDRQTDTRLWHIPREHSSRGKNETRNSQRHWVTAKPSACCIHPPIQRRRWGEEKRRGGEERREGWEGNKKTFTYQTI